MVRILTDSAEMSHIFLLIFYLVLQTQFKLDTKGVMIELI